MDPDQTDPGFQCSVIEFFLRPFSLSTTDSSRAVASYWLRGCVLSTD